MQFTLTAAFLALIGSAIAQVEGFDSITAPTEDEVVTADGKTAATITWEPSSEYDGQKVSILLLQGASQGTLDFYPGDNVACEFRPHASRPLLRRDLNHDEGKWPPKMNIGNNHADQNIPNTASIDSALGTYEWTPESSIAGFALYGLKLQLDSDPTVFQYSFPFKIEAGSDDDTSSSSTSSSSSGKTADTTSADPVTTTTTPATNNNVAASSNEDSAASTSSSTSASAAAAATSTSGSSTTGSSSGSTTGDADTTAAAATTLATATAVTGSGSSATASSSTAAVTAGAARVVAGGLAAVGGVMAMLAL